MSLNPLRRVTADHRTTEYSIAALLTLLVLLNLCGVFVYAKAHPEDGGWVSVWNYLESDTAKLISASLIFPLLIFVVEGRFNLLENIRAARSERRKLAQDERREGRTKAIEETTHFWARTIHWVGAVAYWDGGRELGDLNKESLKLSIEGANAVNGWARFRNTVEWTGPGAATELELHFLRLINALMSCTESIIAYLDRASDDDRDSLQTSLLLIAAGIQLAVHHPLRNILYASRELLDIVESDDVEELRFISSDEQAASRRARLEKTIDENLLSMAAWSSLVKDFLDRSTVLATAGGDEAAALRSSLGDEDSMLRDKYLAIPRDQRFHAWRVDFTRSWLEEFADELSFQLFLTDTEDARSDVRTAQESGAVSA